MTDDQDVPVTLSREDLYELVWSKPLRDLAKDFGISDVGLAKRCRRLGIPLPGRGYWARLDAGQQPYRPTLPKREPEWSDQQALTITPPNEAQSDSATSTTSKDDQAWLQEHIAFEKLADNQIQAPVNATKWDTTIQCYREELEQAAQEMRISRQAHERYEKLSERQRRVNFDHDGYKWRWSKDRGQRLWDTHKAVAFRVSLNTYQRALQLTNTLALAAIERGFSILKDDPTGRIVFCGHNARLSLYVTELLEDRTRPEPRYDGKIEQQKYKVPTGRLRITAYIGYQSTQTYQDRSNQTLETQLNHIFIGFYRLIVKSWHEERKHLERQRQREERERQLAKEKLLREQKMQAIAHERRRRRNLLVEAHQWARSIEIKKYIQHIQTTENEHHLRNPQLADWIEWATRVASELDPTQMRLTDTDRTSS